jgi:hypothetical protein
MSASDDFSKRLTAVRASDESGSVKLAGAYRNGQILAGSDDMSAWDNYDRYFKFTNISVDDPPANY